MSKRFNVQHLRATNRREGCHQYPREVLLVNVSPFVRHNAIADPGDLSGDVAFRPTDQRVLGFPSLNQI